MARFCAYLDEVVMRINGRNNWLWRAVDQDGYVLDEIVPTRRNTKAARRMLTRLLKKQSLPPKRMITDKLRSYGAAKRQVRPAVEHRSHKGLNNRAENSHLPFRKRERTRQGFRSIGSLQHFVSIFSAVRNLFVPSHANRSASKIRKHSLQALTYRSNNLTAPLALAIPSTIRKVTRRQSPQIRHREHAQGTSETKASPVTYIQARGKSYPRYGSVRAGYAPSTPLQNSIDPTH